MFLVSSNFSFTIATLILVWVHEILPRKINGGWALHDG